MKIISVTFRGINDHITGKFTRNRHLVILVIRFAISIGGGGYFGYWILQALRRSSETDLCSATATTHSVVAYHPPGVRVMCVN